MAYRSMHTSWKQKQTSCCTPTPGTADCDQYILLVPARLMPHLFLFCGALTLSHLDLLPEAPCMPWRWQNKNAVNAGHPCRMAHFK